LSKAQLKALIIAREIHPETPATHMNWEENDWRPIRSIRELSVLLKFAPTD
jgi:hypothetical protein